VKPVHPSLRALGFVVLLLGAPVASLWSQAAGTQDSPPLASVLPAADPSVLAAVSAETGSTAQTGAKVGQGTAKAEGATGRVFGRIGIIAAGSFPLSLLYTNFGFDIWKYAATGWDSRYAPWPFTNQYSVEPATAERTLRLGVAVGVSLLVGIADALLGSGSR